MGSHWSRVPFTALKVTLCALTLCKDRNACRFWCDHGTAPTPPGPHLPTPKRWNTHTRKRVAPLPSHNPQVPQNRPPTPPEDYPASCDSVARSVRPGTHRVEKDRNGPLYRHRSSIGIILIFVSFGRATVDPDLCSFRNKPFPHARRSSRHMNGIPEQRPFIYSNYISTLTQKFGGISVQVGTVGFLQCTLLTSPCLVLHVKEFSDGNGRTSETTGQPTNLHKHIFIHRQSVLAFRVIPQEDVSYRCVSFCTDVERKYA